MKVEYKLFELNGHVVFTILNMDERLRAKRGRNLEYHADNGWLVSSVDTPEIRVNGKQIYLRGYDASMDQKVCVAKCDDCEKVIRQINEALAEWAVNNAWIPGEINTFRV